MNNWSRRGFDGCITIASNLAVSDLMMACMMLCHTRGLGIGIALAASVEPRSSLSELLFLYGVSSVDE
jgi:hypothetical protein